MSHAPAARSPLRPNVGPPTRPLLAGAAFVVAALCHAPPAQAQPEEPPDEPGEGPAKPDAKHPGSDAPKGPAADPAEGASADGDADSEFAWRPYAIFGVGPVTLVPTLLLTVQATPYVGEDALVRDGDIADNPGFRLRRADFGLAGEIFRRVRFAASAEVSSDEGGTIAVKDAWVGWTQFPFVQTFVGARRVPFSISAMLGSGDTALAERPLVVRAMAPFNQVGASVEGQVADGAFEYAVGLYNGFHREEFFYGGYLENDAPLGNRFDGLAFAGRLGTEPLGTMSPTVADIDHSPFRFGVGGNYFFSHGGARDVHSGGGDARLHVEGFHFLFEGLFSRSIPAEQPTRPTAEVANIDSFGITAETGYQILRRLLGVHARFEWIDPSTHADNEGDAWLFTGGASVEPLDRLLRIQAEYTHRQERHGLELANDSFTLQFQLELASLGDIPPADETEEEPAAKSAPPAAASPPAKKPPPTDEGEPTDDEPPEPDEDAP